MISSDQAAVLSEDLDVDQEYGVHERARYRSLFPL
jgi:hypothetical protein